MAMAETVNIPSLPHGAMWGRSHETSGATQRCPLKSVGVRMAGKSTVRAELDGVESLGKIRMVSWRCDLRENPLSLTHAAPVPQTDTRGRVEHTKALRDSWLRN